MRITSLPQLQKTVGYLTRLLLMEQYYYLLCDKNGQPVNTDYHEQRIMRFCNELADLKARMDILRLAGETDQITTELALDLLGVKYLKQNSAFYIG